VRRRRASRFRRRRKCSASEPGAAGETLAGTGRWKRRPLTTLPAVPSTASRRRDRMAAGGSGLQPRAGEKGLQDGPDPVDRARNGSKHHLLVDAKGIPLAGRSPAATATHPADPARRADPGRARQGRAAAQAARARDGRSRLLQEDPTVIVIRALSRGVSQPGATRPSATASRKSSNAPMRGGCPKEAKTFIEEKRRPNRDASTEAGEARGRFDGRFQAVR
jgi:hypothetical protein